MSQGCALLILRSNGQRSRSWRMVIWKWFPDDNWLCNQPMIMKTSYTYSPWVQDVPYWFWGQKVNGQGHGAWLFENGPPKIMVADLNLLGSVGDLYCFSNTFSMLLYVAPICCPSCSKLYLAWSNWPDDLSIYLSLLLALRRVLWQDLSNCTRSDSEWLLFFNCFKVNFCLKRPTSRSMFAYKTGDQRSFHLLVQISHLNWFRICHAQNFIRVSFWVLF